MIIEGRPVIAIYFSLGSVGKMSFGLQYLEWPLGSPVSSS